MAGGGASGFGQGGTPNFLPGRGYPEYGSPYFRDMPDDWVGGARGPSALPARITALPASGGGPAPRDIRIRGFDRVGDAGNPFDGTGEQGPISYHRGAYVEDAGAPRLEFDNVAFHGHLPWSRPFYPNIAGLTSFRAPTQMPSWSANAAPQVDRPTTSITYSRKRIANFMVRRPFGDTSSGMLFETGYSLADYVRGIQQGMKVQGRRWISQSKTNNPTLYNRSVYATAGSYGQTTATLNTAPTNVPASSFGAY